jgi:hypothetical protein
MKLTRNRKIQIGGFRKNEIGVDSKYTARVQKLDSNGRMQWERKALSADRFVFRSVAVDGVGNIYAAGIVGQGETSFGNGVRVTGGHPTTNMVLVKYDSQGIARWARTIVNTDDESELDSVAVDSVGNVYAAGSCTCGRRSTSRRKRRDTTRSPRREP